MEGVTVAVGETRKRHAGQDLLTASRFDTDLNSREAPLFHVKADIGPATICQPRVFRPI
jgi:hypothetical protein